MRTLGWWGLIGGLLVLGGCEASGLRRAAVSGTVRVDGQPLAEGSINFFPTEGTEGPTAGAPIVQGKYQIPRANGVTVGKNLVQIQANRKTGRKVPNPMAPGTLTDEIVELLPPEYNTQSTLVRTIEPGSNVLDFDLKTARTGK